MKVEIRNPEVIAQFIYAGRASFTLTSLRTSMHYTFKLEKHGKIWFARVKSGPRHWAYLGLVDEHGNLWHTRKSVSPNSPSFKSLSWFLRQVKMKKSLETVRIQHEGKCGKCGRPLTHPISIELGIGPVCRGETW